MNRAYLGSQDMPAPSTDVIQGTLDMLILKSVALQPMHGFGITQRIEQISGGVFRVNPGSLLLAFQRMERAGLIDSEWRTTENNRRAKFYGITDKGRKQLKEQTREWERRVAAIARLLEA
jgi:PadR family transcriptional regulator, regulatory protein PadR